MLNNILEGFTSDSEKMLYWQINNNEGITRCIIFVMAIYLIASLLITLFCRWRGRDYLALGFVPVVNLALPVFTILGDVFSAVGSSMEESKRKSEERRLAAKEAKEADNSVGDFEFSSSDSSENDDSFDIF